MRISGQEANSVPKLLDCRASFGLSHWMPPPMPDISGIYRGKDAVLQWWREWFAAWETLQFEYELVDAGERVVNLFDLRMRGRSTGIEMPFGKVAWVTTFKDGLIVHQNFYMSQSEALEAVGLSEDARPIPPEHANARDS